MSTHCSFLHFHAPRQFAARRLAPLAAAIALCLAGSVEAANIVVNDLSEGSAAGMCTLADAVSALNTQLSVNGCVAGDGNDDIIDLSSFTVPTSIVFSMNPNGQSHVLQLTAKVTLFGGVDSNGTPYVSIERSSVAGTPEFGLIGTTQSLTIDGLIIRNGSAVDGHLGGAILSGNDVMLTHSIITGNSSSSAGGGIAATGAVSLYQSKVTANSAAYAGGGIQSNATVNINYSDVSGNSVTNTIGIGGGGIYSSSGVIAAHSMVANNSSASDGGAIFASGAIALSDSTISGNSALAGAGGGLNATNGGARLVRTTLYANSAATAGGAVFADDVHITNSTLTGNSAGQSGGGIHTQTATINYATIFANSTQGNGGGMYVYTSANVTGTIVYGNSPQDVLSHTSAALGGSYDLIGTSNVVVPVDTISCDPMLGILADNAGSTLTLSLASGSCAIDAAGATPTVATDQRGYVRPALVGSMPKADIGAYEYGSSSPDAIFANGFEL